MHEKSPLPSGLFCVLSSAAIHSIHCILRRRKQPRDVKQLYIRREDPATTSYLKVRRMAVAPRS